MHAHARTFLHVKAGPARGLPPRIYVPIVALAAIVFLGLIGYFLRIGLGVTGAALGPVAQQGDSDIRTAPAQDEAGQSGEIVVPQTGGNGVGGGTPVPANAGAPPAPIARLLVDLRGRVARNAHDVPALVALGDLYADAAKFTQARQYYRRALAVDPNRPGALFGAGLTARALGRKREAISALHRFVTIAPRDARAPQARAALRDLGHRTS